MRAIMYAFYLMLLFHSVAAQAKPDQASGTFVDTANIPHGAVTLKQQGDMIRGTVKISGLKPGLHAMHLHTIGQCSGDGFMTAGGHWNPQGKQHGLQNPMGAHRGDLPEITVGKDGKGKARFMITSSLSDILDADGAAVVIHANPDDGKTDPSGNSGPRVLCGVIEAGR